MAELNKEIKRLKLTQSLVNSSYPCFGVNKKQEISRLLYEISKREDALGSEIIREMNSFFLERGCAPARDKFDKIKEYLLQRRYPYAFSHNITLQPYLPKIELRKSSACNYETEFYPKRVLIERKVLGSFLAERFKAFFSKAEFREIPSLKSYYCGHRGAVIENYNRRRDTVFIVNEDYDFFKKCPCTRAALSCRYHIFNLGFGCIFECTYCYLQEYANNRGIILPANIDTFFNRLSAYKKTGMRIGTGEFLDSLALDNITGFSLNIVEFFKKQKGVTFEFKTKSSLVENLLKADHAGTIVVSWSLNPQKIIDENEFFTSSLNDRLTAAKQCINAGYRVGFHFDPVIYSYNWQKEYSILIEALFSKINPLHIAWISIGTLRFIPGLKPVIEKRFPANKILDEELLPGFDHKLRYPYAIRHSIYEAMIKMLLGRYKKLKLYLCMEEARMWKELRLRLPEL
ncbi:MAG: hypothetical protein V2A64_00940 [Candidatus Omnitrophota bacterium]